MKIIKENIELITESWAKELNGLSKYTQQQIKDYLIKHKIDIEHTEPERRVIEKSSDEALHDGSIVFLIPQTYSGRTYAGDIIGICNGDYFLNPYLYGSDFKDNITGEKVNIDYKNANRVGIRKLLRISKALIYKQVGELADQMIDLQQQRKDAQRGSVDRVTPETKKRYTKYDKSGYALNPDKYKNMLANLDMSRYQEIIDNAFDLFEEIQGKFRQLRGKVLSDEDRADASRSLKYVHTWGNDVADYLSDISRYFYSTINDFDKAYAEWEGLKNKNSEWAQKFTKPQVTKQLKDLRALINDMKVVKKLIDDGKFIDKPKVEEEG